MSATRPRAVIEQAAIFNRVAERTGARQDTEIAAALGVSAQAFANWRARGTIPFEKLCQFASKNRVSLDWLVLGRGSASVGQALDTVLFGELFQTLAKGAEQMGEAASSAFVIGHACSSYGIAAEQPEAERRRAAGLREVHRALAAFARAKASLMKQGRPTSRAILEAGKLEALAAQFDGGSAG